MVIEPRSRRAHRPGPPDLAVAAEAVAEPIVAAAVEASRTLDRLGIIHALIGGLAVGAHGSPRATKDVDFLVRQSDAFQGTLVISFRDGVPIAVRDVAVDYLTPEGSEHEALLREALGTAGEDATHRVPILGLLPLVVMKLEAGRRRDLDDVRRLVDRHGLEKQIRAELRRQAPRLLIDFDRALAEE